MTNKMKEFLDKVDKICYEYRYEIKPTHPVPDDEYPTLTIIGDGETAVIEFDSPAVGEYEFLCSFPGHSGMMKGKFIVE